MISNNDISNSGPTKGGPLLNRAGDQRPELYKAGARTLLEYHGVPSMTPVNLEKTMALFQLGPGRLVMQGLVPALLDGQHPHGPLSRMEDSGMASSSDDSDSICCSEADENSERSSASDSSSSGSSSDDDDDDGGVQRRNHDGGKRPHRPIHAALVGAGIKLRPRETRPLLRALGVRPQHLVKLGLVNRRTLLGARLDSGLGRGAPRGRRQHSPPPHGPRGPHGHPPPRAPPHGPDGPRGRSKPPACGGHLPPGVAHGPPRRLAHGAGYRSGEGNLKGKHPFRHPPHGRPHHGRPNRGHFTPSYGEGHPRHGPGPECIDIGESEGEERMLLGGGGPPAPPCNGGPVWPLPPREALARPGFGMHPLERPTHHPHRVGDDSSGSEGEEGPEMGRSPHQHGFPRRRHGGRDNHRRFHGRRGHRHGAREHGHEGLAVRNPGHRMREPAGPPHVHWRRQHEQHEQIEAHGAHHPCNRPPPPPPALMMAVH